MEGDDDAAAEPLAMPHDRPAQSATGAAGIGEPLTLGDVLRRAAVRSPDVPALRGDRRWRERREQFTYAELLRASEHCARRLLAQFTPGERIAVWSDSHPEWVVLQFGAALAGLTLVPVNPVFKPHEAEYVLRQARVAGCFAAAEYRGVPLAASVGAMRPSLPELRHVSSFEDWAAFMQEPLTDAPLPMVSPQSLAMIQYTSGTTGFPKGAMLMHERLVRNSAEVARRAQVRLNSSWLLPVPLFHAGGCVMGVLGAMSRDVTVVLVSAWAPDLALELVQEHRIEVLSGVPTMLVGMLAHEDFARRDLRSLTRVIVGASQVPASLVREMRDRLGTEVYVVFGQTECGPVATMSNPEDPPELKQDTVGTPLPGFEIKIVDAETGANQPTGVLGEFCARGDTMLGYFENEAATRLALDAEGWLHTGDLCSIDERGYLRVEGRLKDMIIRGGENIYPREIEELLNSHPNVLMAAVVGLPDPYWGEVVAAFVVPRSRGTFDPASLTDFLKSRLARFKVPQHWFPVDSLPMTATGKVQKFLLRQQGAAAIPRDP